MTLQEAKNWILENATRLGACDSEKLRIENSNNFGDICQVIKDNVKWVVKKGLFSHTKIYEIIPIEFLITSEMQNPVLCIVGNKSMYISNVGEMNTGVSNDGNWNTGSWNIGSYNTGDWNKGSYNIGLFNRCTPKLRIFEQESDWTMNDWLNSRACDVSIKLNLTEWIPSSKMTDEEKEKNPNYTIQDGYIKKYEFKDACRNWWSELTREEKDSFKEIPNFNLEIFEEITGVKFNS